MLDIRARATVRVSVKYSMSDVDRNGRQNIGDEVVLQLRLGLTQSMKGSPTLSHQARSRQG